MKGAIVTNAGAPYELTTEIEKPTPGPDQVLVKSIFSAINPVYVLASRLSPMPGPFQNEMLARRFVHCYLYQGLIAS